MATVSLRLEGRGATLRRADLDPVEILQRCPGKEISRSSSCILSAQQLFLLLHNTETGTRRDRRWASQISRPQ